LRKTLIGQAGWESGCSRQSAMVRNTIVGQ
jgi:hypothetical protein